MTLELNRESLQKIVDEDIEWLFKQPRTLERDHIEAVLLNFVARHMEAKALTAENAKLRGRVAELEAVRVPTMPRPSTGHPTATHRCGICGGVVQFDGTPPNPECWPAGKKRKKPA